MEHAFVLKVFGPPVATRYYCLEYRMEPRPFVRLANTLACRCDLLMTDGTIYAGNQGAVYGHLNVLVLIYDLLDQTEEGSKGSLFVI